MSGPESRLSDSIPGNPQNFFVIVFFIFLKKNFDTNCINLSFVSATALHFRVNNASPP